MTYPLSYPPDRMMQTFTRQRDIYGVNSAGAAVFHAQEIHPVDRESYWISTNIDLAGLVIHHDLKAVISYHLSSSCGKDIYSIDYSRSGQSVFINELVPRELADLVEEALAE
jgi:hypothetical protein